MSNTAIYIRVSTEEQAREGVSLQAQKNKCLLQAELSELNVTHIIEDAGVSAKSTNRAGYQQLMELIKSGEVQSVIIFKLDRIHRDVSNLNHFIKLLNKYDASLISVKDSLDTKSASGRMVINILGVLSQWERETIAERTSDALQHKKAIGAKYTNVTPFGYSLVNENQYIANTEEQKVIKLIVEKRNSGMSFQKIADSLQGQFSTRSGKPWHKGTVRQIFLDSEKRLAA